MKIKDSLAPRNLLTNPTIKDYKEMLSEQVKNQKTLEDD